MTDALRRFARTLVQRLRETPGGPHRAVTVEEVRSRLLPYRAYRTLLGFESVEDYDVVVMRLIGEEGSFVRTLPPLAAERCRVEAESPAPNPELLDQLAEVTIQIGAESLARIFDESHEPPVRAPLRTDLDIIERHLDLEAEELDAPAAMFSPSPPRPKPRPAPEPAAAPPPLPSFEPRPMLAPESPPAPAPAPRPEPPPPPTPEPPPAPRPEPPPAPTPEPPPAPRPEPRPLPAPPPPSPAPEPSPAPAPEPRATPPVRPQLKPRRPLAPTPRVEPPARVDPAPARVEPAAAAAPAPRVEPSPPSAADLPSLPPEVARVPPAATGITCRGCRQSLPGGRQVLFCPWCGARQAALTCPRCNTELEPQWKHCITCGSPVNDSSRLV